MPQLIHIKAIKKRLWNTADTLRVNLNYSSYEQSVRKHLTTTQRAVPVYLDNVAKSIFDEGIENFHTLGLDKSKVLQIGNTVHILPWLGDRITNTITILLRQEGLAADCFGGVIDIRNSSIESFHQAADSILRGAMPQASELASSIPDTIIEKHDPILPKDLRDLGYGTRFFNVNGAWQWFSELSG